MTKEEFIKTGLCEQYVLGLTTLEESKTVEEMLLAYPELKKNCVKLEGCIEKYAREHYNMKKDNEVIYIIEDQDSLKTKTNE